MTMARVNRATNPPATTCIPSIRKHAASTYNSILNAETTTIDSLGGTLRELSIGQAQNRSIGPSQPQGHPQPASPADCCPPEQKTVKHSSRGLRRRAPIDASLFEPLDAVQEESTYALSATALTSAPAPPRTGAPTHVTFAATPAVSSPTSAQHDLSQVNLDKIHPLQAAVPERPKRDQIERHLAGQFEWLLSYPAPAGFAKGQHTSGTDNNNRPPGNLVFGCNLLSRKHRGAPEKEPPECHSANSYTFIATPLDGNALLVPDLGNSHSLRDQISMAMPQPPPYDCHQTTPLKVPEVEVDEVVEQAVSPSLTFISDRSSSYAGGSSRAGSFSVPRIEDSFEELDKLEDELEAVNAFTQQGRVASSSEVKSSPKCLEPPQIKKSTIAKRASMSGMSATVRVKQSDKAQQPIRRSTSLVFRSKKEEPQEPPRSSQVSRSQPTETKTPRPAVKSSKPPTIPKFELPGEAVARRLKEQREARLAQQAEAQKAYVPPPRPKSNKPLTKPSFELPGEAISRRKREERDARLKTQEEEEKKRREFKARPARISSTPSTKPRETIASRARQGKPVNDEAKKSQPANMKRFSIPSLRSAHGGPLDGKASLGRGRLSTMASDENLSRATSTSAGSAGSKRNTLSVEEAHQLRLKGKHIFERDNTSYTQDKERERREREAAARAAREEAAERSRAASREWAEKRKRKETATLQPPKREGQQTARMTIEG